MDKNLTIKTNEFVIALERQVMNCDSKQELLLLAFLMMNVSSKILSANLGEETKRKFFSEHVN